MQGVAPPARTSTIDVPVRILVPSESVGAIIGKGGQTIRQLTQQTRAKVDVYRGDPLGPTSVMQEKVITIRGQPENCINACREILKVMKADAENKSKPSDIPLKVLAHNDYIGRIIGKQGNIINTIKKETETTVTVSSINDISMNVERVITVKGELENMIKALEIIHQKIKSAFENDTKTFGAQAIMMGGIPPIPMVAQAFPFAQTQRYNPQSSQPSSNVNYQTAGFYPPLFSYPPQGMMQAGASAPQQQSSASSSQTNSQAQSAPQGQAASSGAISHASSQNEYLSDVETVYLYIPNVAVGAVIGTKGTFIKNIIKASGASVKITPMSPEDSKNAIERQVVIVGTPEAQWKAQYYIYEKIRQERFASDENFKLKAELHVPTNIVGRIIGKSGKNVKDLQRSTGAIIKLPEDSAGAVGEAPASPNSADKQPQAQHVVVSITGTFNSSQLAQRRIQTLVQQSIRGPSYRPPNHHQFMAGMQMQANFMMNPQLSRSFNGNPQRAPRRQHNQGHHQQQQHQQQQQQLNQSGGSTNGNAPQENNGNSCSSSSSGSAQPLQTTQQQPLGDQQTQQ